METISASKITLYLSRLGSNVNDGPFVVMSVDYEPFIMLTVKRSVMASKLVDDLRNEFMVKRAMVGMAFNFRESAQAGRLITFDDPTLLGIYVPFRDFDGRVRDMLGG